jgi:hypothetical protein
MMINCTTPTSEMVGWATLRRGQEQCPKKATRVVQWRCLIAYGRWPPGFTPPTG